MPNLRTDPRTPEKAELSLGRTLVGSDRDPLSRLKLRHLRFLVALDVHRKLNMAAAEIKVSQPAASKMLAEIEDTVGVALFERLPRGIEPTGYGEVLVRRSRAMLAELSKARTEIAAIRGGAGGTVAIGSVMAPALEAVFEALKEVRPGRPTLQVSVDVAMSDVLVRGLLESRFDFVVARVPPGVSSEDLDYREAQPEECCLVVRKGHPLARKARVSPADLVDCDWVMQPQGSLLRRNLAAMMRRHGLPPPERVLDTGSELVTLAMVARTDAITAVALPVADLLQATGGAFEVLRLTEPLMVEPFGLIRLRSRALSPGAELVYGAVERRLFGQGN